ncbi:LLM class flavin-dependent oxidoreductase [Nocardia alba]|uniref:Alkanesulfonate monooxygenase SsuD/methylene tetrahydromethanopterin reductase-like flavin-dependent oxidoreductase (Luciferase family) n=1 Tax=Nocardia alba TaxID=225051 RepID=A0A4R1FM23_9NOCA|nr:LLM class flavin-dependent oxidoreductase [Nocardia alba]TCJ95623.1 alkanesulfonate monooxygenase SsuD/methylene tetrahydromethanopterin reductase-like flavin-dependent oxidoreductase (luciferase family) [Nocardia alba]
MSRAHVILNVNVLDLGISGAALELSGLPKDTVVSGDYYAEIGRIAERGTLDAYFLADNPAVREDPRLKPGRALEPTTILATVAAATTHLGLIGTLSTTFNDPVELAERLLSLDHLSGGRAAWNAVTTYNPGAGGNFGLTAVPSRAERYSRAHEFVDAVTALWQGAVDGRDIDHRGAHFTISGRLPLGPSPQGHPLIVQAGGSPQGRELAGRTANAVFSAELSLAAGIEHYEQVKQIATGHGRGRDEVAILPGLITIIGSTHAEAVARYERARDQLGPIHELRRLGAVLAHDLVPYYLDEPFPAEVLADLPDPDGFTASLGFRESVVRGIGDRIGATGGRYTLREAIAEFGDGGHRRIIGAPEEVADTIEQWFRAGAADGFNLMPDAFSSGLEIFVDEVVPILRRRGLFRHEYTESTLRARFGSIEERARTAV